MHATQRSSQSILKNVAFVIEAIYITNFSFRILRHCCAKFRMCCVRVPLMRIYFISTLVERASQCDLSNIYLIRADTRCSPIDSEHECCYVVFFIHPTLLMLLERDEPKCLEHRQYHNDSDLNEGPFLRLAFYLDACISQPTVTGEG